jgi:hypothetical protein
LGQAFRKKWWVESDFKAPNLPLSLLLKVSGWAVCNKTITTLELDQYEVLWNRVQQY